MQKIAENRMFEGRQCRYEHRSEVLDCDMKFSVFLPPQAEKAQVPVVYWLSGLTCTDMNFVTKAGAQRHAADCGVAIMCPDTSPRGPGVADDPEEHWDCGLGAGFYVNATQHPWLAHYRMYDYVVTELPALVHSVLPLDSDNRAIAGHSMGGHGALMIGLRNPGAFRSVSALSPIVSVMNCPWGEKAMSTYLGEDRDTWREYDVCELIRQAGEHVPILVDQGDNDEFLGEQLRTDLLIAAAESVRYPMQIRYQPGYDHSYFFIASFIAEHIEFHASFLREH